jgi:SAM-dependent methyltransferase
MNLSKENPALRGHCPWPAEEPPVAPNPRDVRRFGILAPSRSFDANCPELLDRPETALPLIHDELRMLEKMNSRLGGHRLALQYVERLLKSSISEPRVLDLGTGAADVPRAVAAWARERGLRANITAVDGNLAVLAYARESSRAWPEIQFAQHDLRALPFAPKSFDLVMCSLALHHFDWRDAVAILRRMSELARVGFIVNDLRRNWPAIWISELVARAFRRDSLARQDGPQSCRAAFTVAELRSMAREAGLQNFQVHRHHAGFRMVLEGRIG